MSPGRRRGTSRSRTQIVNVTVVTVCHPGAERDPQVLTGGDGRRTAARRPMTHYRLFRRRRILGPRRPGIPRPLAARTHPMGTRVSASLPCAGPGLSPRSSVGVLVAGPVGRLTGKPRKRERPAAASGHRPTARRHGRIVSPGCTHRRTTWTLVVTGPTVRMWGFFTPSGWVECWRADRRGAC